MPELGATFRVSLDCNDERLLSQARTLLQEAKPFAGTFVAHELPSNFLGQLQAAVDAFERAMRERASGRDQRVAARARFEASMEAALRAVKRLNAIVSNKLNDPVGMASWNLARRIDYGRVRRSGAATPDGTTDSSSAQADAARPAARLPEPWSFVRARRRVREPAGSCSRYPWRRGTLFLTGSAGRATSQQTLHSAANREAGRHVEAWTTRRDRHDLLDAAGGAMAEISAATRAAG
jgi:hypothetical protein